MLWHSDPHPVLEVSITVSNIPINECFAVQTFSCGTSNQCCCCSSDSYPVMACLWVIPSDAPKSVSLSALKALIPEFFFYCMYEPSAINSPILVFQCYCLTAELSHANNHNKHHHSFSSYHLGLFCNSWHI